MRNYSPKDLGPDVDRSPMHSTALIMPQSLEEQLIGQALFKRALIVPRDACIFRERPFSERCTISLFALDFVSIFEE
jgi:hypothetical protein